MLKYLSILVFLFGCGGVNVTTPETKDQDVNLSGEQDSATVDETSPVGSKAGRPKPALVNPDECGDEYAAKVVYEDGDQKLYACVRNNNSGTQSPSENPLEVLEGCPYTAEIQADRSLTLTYVSPATEKNPVVYPSYNIPKNTRSFDILLTNGGGQTPACWVHFWDGDRLEYTDAPRTHQYTYRP